MKTADRKIPFDEGANSVSLERANRVLAQVFGRRIPPFEHQVWIDARSGMILLRKSNPRKGDHNYYLHQAIDGPVLTAITLWSDGSTEVHFYHHDFLLPAHLEDDRMKLYRKERWPNIRIEDVAVTETFGVDVLTAYLDNIWPEATKGTLKQGGSSVAERRVLKIARQTFPETVIHSRWRGSDWLGRLELDVFLPSLGFAIEVQGDQHYRPIWGKESKNEIFSDIQLRDQRKASRCRENRVRLLRIRESQVAQSSNQELAAVLQRGLTGPYLQDWPE